MTEYKPTMSDFTQSEHRRKFLFYLMLTDVKTSRGSAKLFKTVFPFGCEKNTSLSLARTPNCPKLAISTLSVFQHINDTFWSLV